MLAELEELMESVRVWRPSLTTIATISEVVPIPREVMDEILERFRVDPLIKPYVVEYVKRRPLLDELRILVNEYYRMKYYSAVYKQTIPQDIEQAVQKYMQLFGLTEEERAIRDLVAKIRETVEMWRESAREYIPTPSMLATIYEYVPSLTDDMIVKVLDARHVPAEWRKIWIDYIKNRVIADDVRALISSFYRMKRYAARYGQTVPEDIAKAVEGYMTKIGFTEEEKKIRDLASEIDVTIEMWRENAREYIPTPAMLATIYEYVPTLTNEDIIEVLKARHVPEKWINIWLSYIKSRAIADDVRSLVSAYFSLVRYATRYGQKVPDEIAKAVQSYMQLIGLSKEELEVRQLVATIYELIESWREWRPSLLTLISMIEYVPEAIGLLNYYNVAPMFRPVVEKYARVKPLADEFRSLLNLYYRDYVWFEIPQEIVKAVNEYSKLLGFTDEELRLRSLRAWLEWLDDLWREWKLTPARIVSLAEYVHIDIEIIDRYLRYVPIDEDEKELWIKYIRLRPIKSDYRAVISTAIRALRYRAITEDRWKKILEEAKGYGFTDPEISLLQLRSELELAIEDAREYIPTPSMLATISEYVPSITDEMINKVLEARRVPQEWRAIWVQYIKARAIADEVRSLLSAFYRLKRYAIFYGYAVPKDIEDAVMKFASMIGVTDVERSIRDMTAYIEATIDMWRTGEVYPTLSTLVTMAEYINVPVDYVKKVLEARRIEPTYASLWLQYLYARSISGEVNRVVSAFEAIYTRFSVPEEVVNRVTSLMAQGGWTDQELRIFSFELELRRAYRVLVMLVPSIRQFVTDAQYLPDYEKLFQDLLQVYAIDVEKYKKQVEYYKRLLKNRRLWRHLSWYRTQLTYAYMYGAMDENQVRQKLQQFVNIGLLDPDEVNIIVDGIKIRKVAYEAYRATRYG
jgi:antitoxin component HigA of HigAB toxin-antitoxin module/transcriptional regulator with XRE-family HTH domain